MAFTEVWVAQQSTYCIGFSLNHVQTPGLVYTKHLSWFQIILDLSELARSALRNMCCEGPF